MVTVLAGLAAIGVTLGGAAPAGWLPADVVLDCLLGVGLVVASSRARRVPWFVLLLGAGVVAEPTWALALTFAGAGVAIYGVLQPRRSHTVGAAVGAIAAIALTHGTGLHPVPALVVSSIGVLGVTWSAYGVAQRRSRKQTRRVVFVVSVAVGAAAIGYGVSAATARAPIDRGLRLMQEGLDAARSGDRQTAASKLADAATALAQAHDDLRAPWAMPARVVPLLGQNAASVEGLLAAARELAATGARAAAKTDIDQLRFQGGAIPLSAISALEAPLQNTYAALQRADAELRDLHVAWLVPPLRDRVDDAADRVAKVLPDARRAVDAVRVLPDLLGASQPRHYFVAFTTPSEARGRIGFIGNFAELEASGGRLRMVRFGRTLDLNNGGAGNRHIDGPPDYLARYARFGPEQTWANVTVSPDLPTVADVIGQLYPQSAGEPIDGVLFVDPDALAALLRYTGPITVAGRTEPLTADNAAQFLLIDQYSAFQDKTDRVDSLEEVARTTFDRLTNGDLPAPQTLITDLAPIVATGHLAFVPFPPAARAFATDAELTGEMPPVDGDALAVTVANASANKIDTFLHRDIDYEATWNRSTGVLDATITVALRNDAPTSGLPDYVIGNKAKTPGQPSHPEGTNTTFLTVYTPWALQSATLDGAPINLEVLPEVGRQALSTFLSIPSMTTQTLVIHVSGVLDRCDYRLDVATQPLPHPDKAHVRVHGPEPTIDERWTLDRTRTLGRERC